MKMVSKVFHTFLTLWLASFFWQSLLFGQDLPFRKFTTENGLSNNRILSLLQDQFGYIWIGTDDGLNRYDGYDFEVFHHLPGSPNAISHNAVYALVEDQKGMIWIATGNGLDVYDPYTEQIKPFSLLQQNSLYPEHNFAIRAMLLDSLNNLWVGTHMGLWQINPARNRVKFISSSSTEIPNGKAIQGEIRSLSLSKKGDLLVGGTLGVMILSKDSSSLVRAPGFSSFRKVRAIFQDWNHRWWVGTWDKGIFYKEKDGENWHSLGEEIPTPIPLNSSIRVIHQSKKFQFLLGTGNGLAQVDLINKQIHIQQPVPGTPFGLSHPGIRCILEDNQHNLWIGTWRGLNFYSPTLANFDLIRKIPGASASLTDNSVSSFAEDKQGGLWIGTENGGLHYMESQTGQINPISYETQPDNPINAADIKALAFDEKGFLWIGTHEYGLIRFDPNTRQRIRFIHDPMNAKSISGNQVYVLYKDRSGLLWIGTNYHGLNSIDPNTFEISRYCYREKKGCMQHPSVKSIEEDYLGNIWIGTSAGLHLLDKASGSFHFFGMAPNQSDQGLLSPMIRSLFEDSKKQLWVGTSAGLARFDRASGTFETHLLHPGKGSVVNALEEDKQGNLWISTNNGLFKHRATDGIFLHFTDVDGLQGRQFNPNAVYKTQKGIIYFGGVNGFNRFDPQNIQLPTQEMQIHVTDFWLLNQHIKPNGSDGIVPYSFLLGPQLNLTHRQNMFSFEFVALNYAEPLVQYAYQIEGLQPDWIETGTDRRVALTGLPPGDYVFRVRAKGRNGYWQAATNDLQIHISKSFWQTPFAIFSYILLGLLMLGGTYWIIIRMARLKHNLNIERIKQENAEELHQSQLRFFTNISHDFRTPLTLMVGPLEALLKDTMPNIQLQVNKIKQQVDRLMNLIDQLLYFRKLETNHIKLKAAKGELNVFLEELILMFEAYAENRDIALTYEPEALEVWAWYDRDLLERVILNLLSNALKYTTAGGQIKVYLSKVEASPKFSSGKVKITIVDTGKGISQKDLNNVFDRYYQVGNETGEGTGIGLSLVQEIVQLHGGEVLVESQLGKGSTFSVLLPLGKDHLRAEEWVSDFHDSGHKIDYPLFLPSVEAPKEMALSPEDLKKAPCILIVEDNAEVCQYIASILAPNYRVELAQNGQEGFQKVLTFFPDLIISDVMMPNMNGIDLCRKLRQDIRISHIPLILLTARVSVMYQVEALEIGADDYLSKPFHPSVLLARVKNLIESRIKLRERFEMDIPIAPQPLPLHKQENAFLEKLINLLETNLDDQTMNVERLGHELGMSRGSLFLKLKALTDLAPSDFIRNYKLKRASQILLESDYTVAEVAYMVGFNSPSHFSSAFKRQYDESPSQYVNRMRVNS